jgi:hypothetical protein
VTVRIPGLRAIAHRRSLVLLAAALVIAGCGAPAAQLSQGTFESGAPIPSASTTASTPTPTASATLAPTPSPISVAMSSSARFSLLPTAQPADFVSHISCNGSIGPSDPVAVVGVQPTGTAIVQLVLRDYADPASPRTACTFGEGIVQLIDARHVVIRGNAGSILAVVDLPDVRYHWFALPAQEGASFAEFLAVAPGLEEIAWESSSSAGAERRVHLTTTAGDRVVAPLPSSTGGRCGSPDDSRQAAYTHSGEHLYVLDQLQPSQNVLMVFDGTEPVLSLIPPGGAWPQGGQPAMAIWSPVLQRLFYRQDGDVWEWTPGSDPRRYLSGVAWSHPTISADGGHLAYALSRPGGRHDVYLVDLAHDPDPRLIGEARNLPVFLNASQLWLESESQGGVCGPGAGQPLVYDVNDGSESPSIIQSVHQAWPATSSNY